MALTKKAQTKAKANQPRKHDQADEKAAFTKAKPLKAAKKSAAQSKRTKTKAKCEAVKQHRICVAEAKGQSDAGGLVAQELDPFEVAKQAMKGAVPAIVEAMVELAKQGSCSHAKTLLEMTGAKHMFASDAEMQGSGEPWAKLVLARLNEADCEAEQEALRLQEGRAVSLAER